MKNDFVIKKLNREQYFFNIIVLVIKIEYLYNNKYISVIKRL